MTATLPKASETRQASHPIDRMFLDRWSPRALSGQPISEKDLMILFEAARWAPSSFNNQPWRLIYARRDTPAWEALFGLLGDFNKAWCVDAAALILFISKTSFDHRWKALPNTLVRCGRGLGEPRVSGKFERLRGAWDGGIRLRPRQDGAVDSRWLHGGCDGGGGAAG